MKLSFFVIHTCRAGNEAIQHKVIFPFFSNNKTTGECCFTGPLQQDPNDPTKWQVVNTSQAVTPLTIPTLSSPTSQVSMETPTPGKRTRRVACNCPNCQNGDGPNK